MVLLTHSNFNKILDVFVNELDLSHLRDAAALPDALACRVTVSLSTSLRSSPTEPTIWSPSSPPTILRSCSRPVLFHRVPSAPSRFRTSASPLILQLEPRFSTHHYPSSLQLDLSIHSAGFTCALEATYDYVVDGRFVPEGASDRSHRRGRDAATIGMSWFSREGGTRILEGAVSAGHVRGVLESALTSGEEAARSAHALDSLVRPLFLAVSPI